MGVRPSCPYCGQPVMSTNPRAVYCRRQCKEAAKQRRDNIAANRQRPKVQCGTHSGYVMHLRRGEDACVECKAATAARALAHRRARGIEPRPPIQSRIYPCLNCGQDATRSRFCSVRCRVEYVVPAIPCAECATPFIPAHRAQQYCSLPCRRKWNNRLGREQLKPWAIERWPAPIRGPLQRGGYRVPGEVLRRSDVYERDGWICGLCNGDVDPALKWPDPMSVSLDHIVPVSRGGMHSLANVQCSHLTCNVSKGNRVNQEAPRDPHPSASWPRLLEPEASGA